MTRPQKEAAARHQIQVLRAALAYFRMVVHASGGDSKKALLAVLDREAEAIREIGETLPHDAGKRVKAAGKRIKKELDRCQVFTVH